MNVIHVRLPVLKLGLGTRRVGSSHTRDDVRDAVTTNLAVGLENFPVPGQSTRQSGEWKTQDGLQASL